MVTLRFLIGAFLLAVSVSPCAVMSAFAVVREAGEPQATNFTLQGKVTQHSEGKLTVSTEENIIFHVRYNEKTEIKRQDGTSGSPRDLRIGSKISVEGDLTESGEIVAQKIEIEKNSDSKRR